MRLAARRDANEPALITIAKQFGALWIQTGPLDGWIFYRHTWTPVEIKAPKGHYKPSQVKFFARCKEREAPVWVWRTERDVFESMGAKQTA